MVVDVLLQAGLLILAVIFLWKGAGWLVESASRIATSFGISELVIGLTVIAFGTSAPEFAVTINAALRNQADISVSNIVGSNIFNLGLILGSVAIIRSIRSSPKLVYRDGVFMFFATLLLLVFLWDFHFSRGEGLILMAVLVIYMILLFFKKEPLEEEEFPCERATWRDYVQLPAGIAAVVAGGHVMVGAASFIARTVGISEWVIGVTIVAAGTSAPEMATSLAAALKGKHGMSAGNLIGSDLFNILGVLGLAGVINPMTIAPEAVGSLLMLSGMVLLVVFFLRTGWQLSRLEGMILVGIGVTRWLIDFLT